jgi:hypothetical protein
MNHDPILALHASHSEHQPSRKQMDESGSKSPSWAIRRFSSSRSSEESVDDVEEMVMDAMVQEDAASRGGSSVEEDGADLEFPASEKLPVFVSPAHSGAEISLPPMSPPPRRPRAAVPPPPPRASEPSSDSHLSLREQSLRSALASAAGSLAALAKCEALAGGSSDSVEGADERARAAKRSARKGLLDASRKASAALPLPALTTSLPPRLGVCKGMQILRTKTEIRIYAAFPGSVVRAAVSEGIHRESEDLSHRHSASTTRNAATASLQHCWRCLVFDRMVDPQRKGDGLPNRHRTLPGGLPIVWREEPRWMSEAEAQEDIRLVATASTRTGGSDLSAVGHDTIAGLLGVAQWSAGWYLVLAHEAEPVGVIGNSSIWGVSTVEVVPVAWGQAAPKGVMASLGRLFGTDVASLAEKRFRHSLRSALGKPFALFFSHSYDLTRPLQGQVALNVTRVANSADAPSRPDDEDLHGQSAAFVSGSSRVTSWISRGSPGNLPLTTWVTVDKLSRKSVVAAAARPGRGLLDPELPAVGRKALPRPQSAVMHLNKLAGRERSPSPSRSSIDDSVVRRSVTAQGNNANENVRFRGIEDAMRLHDSYGAPSPSAHSTMGGSEVSETFADERIGPVRVPTMPLRGFDSPTLASSLERALDHAQEEPEQFEVPPLVPPPHEMFVWNHNLIEPLAGTISPSWVTPVICGSFGQVSVSRFGRPIVLSLVSRRSRHFAGTRYLKRGVSRLGYVANEVELEQILDDTTGGFASFVQHRGSVPLAWTQRTNLSLPKPPITIFPADASTMTGARQHFASLLSRHGSPILCLNLLRKGPRAAREGPLGETFAATVKTLNRSLPPGERLQYASLDFASLSKSRSHQVLTALRASSEWAVANTGVFVARPGKSGAVGLARAWKASSVQETPQRGGELSDGWGVWWDINGPPSSRRAEQRTVGPAWSEKQRLLRTYLPPVWRIVRIPRLAMRFAPSTLMQRARALRAARKSHAVQRPDAGQYPEAWRDERPPSVHHDIVGMMGQRSALAQDEIVPREVFEEDVVSALAKRGGGHPPFQATRQFLSSSAAGIVHAIRHRTIPHHRRGKPSSEADAVMQSVIGPNSPAVLAAVAASMPSSSSPVLMPPPSPAAVANENWSPDAACLGSSELLNRLDGPKATYFHQHSPEWKNAVGGSKPGGYSYLAALRVAMAMSTLSPRPALAQAEGSALGPSSMHGMPPTGLVWPCPEAASALADQRGRAMHSLPVLAPPLGPWTRSLASMSKDAYEADTSAVRSPAVTGLTAAPFAVTSAPIEEIMSSIRAHVDSTFAVESIPPQFRSHHRRVPVRHNPAPFSSRDAAPASLTAGNRRMSSAQRPTALLKGRPQLRFVTQSALWRGLLNRGSEPPMVPVLLSRDSFGAAASILRAVHAPSRLALSATLLGDEVHSRYRAQSVLTSLWATRSAAQRRIISGSDSQLGSVPSASPWESVLVLHRSVQRRLFSSWHRPRKSVRAQLSDEPSREVLTRPPSMVIDRRMLVSPKQSPGMRAVNFHHESDDARSATSHGTVPSFLPLDGTEQRPMDPFETAAAAPLPLVQRSPQARAVAASAKRIARPRVAVSGLGAETPLLGRQLSFPSSSLKVVSEPALHRVPSLWSVKPLSSSNLSERHQSLHGVSPSMTPMMTPLQYRKTFSWKESPSGQPLAPPTTQRGDSKRLPSREDLTLVLDPSMCPIPFLAFVKREGTPQSPRPRQSAAPAVIAAGAAISPRNAKDVSLIGPPSVEKALAVGLQMADRATAEAGAAAVRRHRPHRSSATQTSSVHSDSQADCTHKIPWPSASASLRTASALGASLERLDKDSLSPAGLLAYGGLAPLTGQSMSKPRVGNAVSLSQTARAGAIQSAFADRVVVVHEGERKQPSIPKSVAATGTSASRVAAMRAGVIVPLQSATAGLVSRSLGSRILTVEGVGSTKSTGDLSPERRRDPEIPSTITTSPSAIAPGSYLYFDGSGASASGRVAWPALVRHRIAQQSTSKDRPGSSQARWEGGGGLMFFQSGIVRSNCVDCLDRTSVAQAVTGIAALGPMLSALGWDSSSDLVVRSVSGLDCVDPAAVRLAHASLQQDRLAATAAVATEGYATVASRSALGLEGAIACWTEHVAEGERPPPSAEAAVQAWLRQGTDATDPLAQLLRRLYESAADALAQQYGGSAANKRVNDADKGQADKEHSGHPADGSTQGGQKNTFGGSPHMGGIMNKDEEPRIVADTLPSAALASRQQSGRFASALSRSNAIAASGAAGMGAVTTMTEGGSRGVGFGGKVYMAVERHLQNSVLDASRQRATDVLHGHLRPGHGVGWEDVVLVVRKVTDASNGRAASDSSPRKLGKAGRATGPLASTYASKLLEELVVSAGSEALGGGGPLVDPAWGTWVHSSVGAAQPASALMLADWHGGLNLPWALSKLLSALKKLAAHSPDAVPSRTVLEVDRLADTALSQWNVSVRTVAAIAGAAGFMMGPSPMKQVMAQAQRSEGVPLIPLLDEAAEAVVDALAQSMWSTSSVPISSARAAAMEALDCSWGPFKGSTGASTRLAVAKLVAGVVGQAAGAAFALNDESSAKSLRLRLRNWLSDDAHQGRNPSGLAIALACSALLEMLLPPPAAVGWHLLDPNPSDSRGAPPIALDLAAFSATAAESSLVATIGTPRPPSTGSNSGRVINPSSSSASPLGVDSMQTEDHWAPSEPSSPGGDGTVAKTLTRTSSVYRSRQEAISSQKTRGRVHPVVFGLDRRISTAHNLKSLIRAANSEEDGTSSLDKDGAPSLDKDGIESLPFVEQLHDTLGETDHESSSEESPRLPSESVAPSDSRLFRPNPPSSSGERALSRPRNLTDVLLPTLIPSLRPSVLQAMREAHGLAGPVFSSRPLAGEAESCWWPGAAGGWPEEEHPVWWTARTATALAEGPGTALGSSWGEAMLASSSIAHAPASSSLWSYASNHCQRLPALGAGTIGRLESVLGAAPHQFGHLHDALVVVAASRALAGTSSMFAAAAKVLSLAESVLDQVPGRSRRGSDRSALAKPSRIDFAPPPVHLRARNRAESAPAPMVPLKHGLRSRSRLAAASGGLELEDEGAASAGASVTPPLLLSAQASPETDAPDSRERSVFKLSRDQARTWTQLSNEVLDTLKRPGTSITWRMEAAGGGSVAHKNRPFVRRVAQEASELFVRRKATRLAGTTLEVWLPVSGSSRLRLKAAPVGDILKFSSSPFRLAGWIVACVSPASGGKASPSTKWVSGDLLGASSTSGWIMGNRDLVVSRKDGTSPSFLDRILSFAWTGFWPVGYDTGFKTVLPTSVVPHMRESASVRSPLSARSPGLRGMARETPPPAREAVFPPSNLGEAVLREFSQRQSVGFLVSQLPKTLTTLRWRPDVTPGSHASFSQPSQPAKSVPVSDDGIPAPWRSQDAQSGRRLGKASKQYNQAIAAAVLHQLAPRPGEIRPHFVVAPLLRPAAVTRELNRLGIAVPRTFGSFGAAGESPELDTIAGTIRPLPGLFGGGNSASPVPESSTNLPPWQPGGRPLLSAAHRCAPARARAMYGIYAALQDLTNPPVGAATATLQSEVPPSELFETPDAPQVSTGWARMTPVRLQPWVLPSVPPTDLISYTVAAYSCQPEMPEHVRAPLEESVERQADGCVPCLSEASRAWRNAALSGPLPVCHTGFDIRANGADPPPLPELRPRCGCRLHGSESLQRQGVGGRRASLSVARWQCAAGIERSPVTKASLNTLANSEALWAVTGCAAQPPSEHHSARTVAQRLEYEAGLWKNYLRSCTAAPVRVLGGELAHA